jgi:hypothetical protein
LRQVVAIVVAIAAAFVLAQFLFDFYDWNRMQSCATAGGRNCGGGPTHLER